MLTILIEYTKIKKLKKNNILQNLKSLELYISVQTVSDFGGFWIWRFLDWVGPPGMISIIVFTFSKLFHFGIRKVDSLLSVVTLAIERDVAIATAHSFTVLLSSHLLIGASQSA